MYPLRHLTWGFCGWKSIKSNLGRLDFMHAQQEEEEEQQQEMMIQKEAWSEREGGERGLRDCGESTA